MTGLRECPRAGCTKRISGDLFACSPHWYSLPPEIRDAIWKAWRAYQRRQTGPPRSGGRTTALEDLHAAHARAFTYWGQAAP